MAKYSRIEVVLKMREAGIVPVFYHKDPEVCRNVIKSCFEGGIKVFEFTNRGDYAHELFAELNKWAEKEAPGLAMGAGSIVDAGTASLIFSWEQISLFPPFLILRWPKFVTGEKYYGHPVALHCQKSITLKSLGLR
jgi:hypothetical protein